MKIMGLDVSSHSTGWNIIEAISDDIKIVGYGLIRCDSSMGPTQRLYFQGNELKKQIEKFCPDQIGIEETILVRGPKIMRTLARFSGVAIFLAYSYQKKEIHVFEPSLWKKNLGIGGNATKSEVQLEICSRFSLLSQKQIDTYKEVFKSIEESVTSLKITAKQQKTPKKELNKKIKEIEKMYDKVSTDIYSDCGINNDIADSFGVSLAVLNEIK
jgi:crossover junction endodeoxyribonuclease RuvC